MNGVVCRGRTLLVPKANAGSAGSTTFLQMMMINERQVIIDIKWNLTFA